MKVKFFISMSMENDNFRRKGIDWLATIIGGRYHQNPFEKEIYFSFAETFRSYKRIVGDGRRILAFV